MKLEYEDLELLSLFMATFGLNSAESEKAFSSAVAIAELSDWQKKQLYEFRAKWTGYCGTVSNATIAVGGLPVTAPVAGTVTRLCVSDGARVSQGQPVVIIESMKMELEVKASGDGEVSYLVQAGETVSSGTILATIGGSVQTFSGGAANKELFSRFQASSWQYENNPERARTVLWNLASIAFDNKSALECAQSFAAYAKIDRSVLLDFADSLQTKSALRSSRAWAKEELGIDEADCVAAQCGTDWEIIKRSIGDLIDLG